MNLGVDVGTSLAPAFWALAFVLVATAAAIVAGRERPDVSRRGGAASRLRVLHRDSA